MAHPDSLDADGVLPRTRAHSDAIAENLELGQAWDDFGLVADIVVSVLSYLCFFLFMFLLVFALPHNPTIAY